MQKISQTALDKAQQIKDKAQKGDLTSSQCFARLASLGKIYNVSVFDLEKGLVASKNSLD